VESYYLGILVDATGSKFYPVEIEPITLNPFRCKIVSKYAPKISFEYAWVWWMGFMIDVHPKKDLHFFTNPITEKEVV
jgi:hypothetical protein